MILYVKPMNWAISKKRSHVFFTSKLLTTRGFEVVEGREGHRVRTKGLKYYTKKINLKTHKERIKKKAKYW